MPRVLTRLSARFVSAQTKPGIYADGAGLYLRVRSATSRSWVFVWHVAGKRREMGLGSPPQVGLAKARERAQAAREIIADGGDPVALRRRQKAVPTFGEMADQFIKDRSFRDWAGEATDTPREVAEAALAHTAGNNAELAYRRGDALDKRRKLMQAWGAYCSPTAE